MRTHLVLLLALLAACASASRLTPGAGTTVDTSPHSTRTLQQSLNMLCPDGCDRDNGGCVQDNTMAGLRCIVCLGTLIVDKITGNCSCPAGRYATATTAKYTCTDCPKGSFCPGGSYAENSTDANAIPITPVKVDCPTSPAQMTTIGKRKITLRDCVNTAGTYYSISADGLTVSATTCPVDTYSRGMMKQRACVPCPTGFTTNGATGRTKSTDCLVPAGSYLKAPGQVAPCPQGEYKPDFGADGNCTKCAFGVTTAGEGSISVDNCTILLPGYYAAAMNGAIVTSTIICPQSYYCPGGVPRRPVQRHLKSLVGQRALHQDLPLRHLDGGARLTDRRSVPDAPGYSTDLLANTTTQCPIGEYRADWKPANLATSCLKCGTSIKSLRTDTFKVWDIVTRVESQQFVTTSADDCYIEPGQGLYFLSTSSAWRAKNCTDNQYGVTGRTFGLSAAPCKDCPTGMTANNNGSYSNSSAWWVNGTDYQGFASVKACVTLPGYGYDGRVAQKCNVGFWNPSNNYDVCKACPYGMSTACVGCGVFLSDCGVRAGFGATGGIIRECAIGTYNNISIGGACTNCSTGTTTPFSGADTPLMCNLCQPGYGGTGDDNSGCTNVCGNGTYGVPGRGTGSACANCSTQETGYSFSWQLKNDIYPVKAISKDYASSSIDCVSEFAQIQDGAWYMRNTYNVNSTFVTPNILTFAACVDLCKANSQCQFVTYDYIAKSCTVRVAATQVYVGAPVIGFKNVPSGDVGTNAWSIKRKAAQAKGVGTSGTYTFWQDPFALQVGTQTAAPGASGFQIWQDCLSACDDDWQCAAFVIEITVDVNARPTTCKLVKGVYDVAEFKRTMTRAVLSRLSDISGNLK